MNVNSKQIKWRFVEGVLELDVILHRFYDKKFDSLSTEDKNLFATMLEEPGPVLINWLIKREPSSSKFKKLTQEILELC